MLNLDESASGFSYSTLKILPKQFRVLYFFTLLKLLGVDNLPNIYKARCYTAYNKSGS